MFGELVRRQRQHFPSFSSSELLMVLAQALLINQICVKNKQQFSLLLLKLHACEKVITGDFSTLPSSPSARMDCFTEKTKQERGK